MGLLESCWWWKDLRILLTHLVLRWWLTRIVDLGVSLWRHSCTAAMFTAYGDIVYTAPSFWWMLFWNLLFKNIKIKITWAFVLITTGTPACSNSVSYYRSQRADSPWYYYTFKTEERNKGRSSRSFFTSSEPTAWLSGGVTKQKSKRQWKKKRYYYYYYYD